MSSTQERERLHRKSDKIEAEHPDMLSVDNRDLFSLASNLTYLNHGGFGATPKSVLAEKKRILDEIEKNPAEFLSYKVRTAWHQIADKIAGRFGLRRESLAIVENTSTVSTLYCAPSV